MKSSKKKKIQQIEAQDAKGISRKHWKHTMSLEVFVFLKIFGIIMIPLCYFLYSPLLILCMIYYIALYYFAIMTERKVNVSVIKENHLKLMKFDSAVALFVVVIALFGTFMTSGSSVKQGMFSDFDRSEVGTIVKGGGIGSTKSNRFWSSVKSYFLNFCTLLSGERSVFSGANENNLIGDPPENFNFSRDDFLDNAPTGNFQMSLDNLPVQYVFSTLLNSVEMILTFSVSGLGCISLIILAIKKKKYAVVMNENIVDEFLVDEKEIDRILSFGEEVPAFDGEAKGSEITFVEIKDEEGGADELQEEGSSEDLQMENKNEPQNPDFSQENAENEENEPEKQELEDDKIEMLDSGYEPPF